MNRATIIIVRASPMRLLRAWLFRERAIRGPGAIELDVVERQIDREQAAIFTTAGEATTIEQKLDRARSELRASMADGVVDLTEYRSLARQLIGTSVAAHHHTEHLEALK